MDILLIATALALMAVTMLGLKNGCNSNRGGRYIDTVLEYRNGQLTEVHK